MKKKKIKKQVPAYAFGIEQLGNTMGNYAGIGSLLGSGLQGIFDNPEQQKVTGGEIAGGALSGAAKGASIGMAAGPIGAVAGGVIGLAGGLFSGFNKKKQLEEIQRKKDSVNSTKMGLANSAIAEQEYWANNNQAYTFENGGILPNLAYLDNEEIVRSNNGDITQVPNNTQGTDQHLVNATNLESVLSDKIKRPSTGKTFAEEGKILSRMTKPSKGKDTFAQNTDKLNKMNANAAYNALLQEQEALKASKGIKPKTKGIPAYKDGKGDNDSLEYNLPEIFVTPNNLWQGVLPNRPTTPEVDYNGSGKLAHMYVPNAFERAKNAKPGSNYDSVNSLMSLAPTAYNFMQSLKSPDYEATVTNPYASAISRTMAKRKTNIDPTLAANRRSRAIANYNLSKLSSNTGMNLAARTQLAAGEYAQNADVYANAQNVNNTYLGEYANTLNNLGQQYVQGSTLSNDLNARNRAASRNYGATASSQIGQWAQVQQQMANQRRNDEMMFPLLGNFMSYGQTSGTMADLYNNFYRRK